MKLFYMINNLAHLHIPCPDLTNGPTASRSPWVLQKRVSILTSSHPATFCTRIISGHFIIEWEDEALHTSRFLECAAGCVDVLSRTKETS
ncbi:hypothetical protein I7I53_07056 [Histoplasma capsulatum var. duboisii H88]|uniref:Uncharacterized protein n=1 Tax=Ajellomyces capsulatus (strain H88) TaxID=544711 RepID=A0A8A1LIR0_AJEC8|nr:hypothetical protein I7I53_07056 [Histoplasma capsulatum var. duboisii H88]